MRMTGKRCNSVFYIAFIKTGTLWIHLYMDVMLTPEGFSSLQSNFYNTMENVQGECP